MPRPAQVYSILIASPSDVAEERRTIAEVVNTWNAAHSRATGAVLEAVRWESHARPASGAPPQELINRQIVDDCDLLVGAFWTRIGTQTEAAESGTLEEIERFVRAGKPVMLYFTQRPVMPGSIDQDQYRRLTEFKQRWMRVSGIAFEYDSVAQFREMLATHLAAALHDLHRAAPPPQAMSTASQLDAVLDVFDLFITRLRVAWTSEKESEPYSLDDAKYLLQDAVEHILDVRAHPLVDRNPKPRSLLETALRKAKELQKHEVYVDGGVSYDAFWRAGDYVLEVLSDFPAELKRSAEERDAYTGESA